MNTNVDVLEVMRKSANVASMNALDHGGKVLMNFADDCELARAAVAELIDKVDSYVTLGHSDTAYRELSEALARVKGA